MTQVVELYERCGLAHRPDHEVAPCPRLADYVSAFIQEVACFQFSGNPNHRGQNLAKILRGVGFAPRHIAVDVGLGDVDFVRSDTRERINHP